MKLTAPKGLGSLRQEPVKVKLGLPKVKLGPLKVKLSPDRIAKGEARPGSQRQGSGLTALKVKFTTTRTAKGEATRR